MKCTRLEVKNYLRGRLGASLEENGAWRMADGGGEIRGGSGSPVHVRGREKREREKREREREREKERLTQLKLPTSHANWSGVSRRLLWRDWWTRGARLLGR
jgi:hypothetical protein